jgi:hypothetical protein
MNNKIVDNKQAVSIIIDIKKFEITKFICDGLDNDEEFKDNVTKFIRSELIRKDFANHGISKRAWQSVDLSANKVIKLFCVLLRTDNEVSNKLKKLIKKVKKELDENNNKT